MLVGDVPWLYDILLSLVYHLYFVMRHILFSCFFLIVLSFFLYQDVPWVREKTENHEKIR